MIKSPLLIEGAFLLGDPLPDRARASAFSLFSSLIFYKHTSLKLRESQRSYETNRLKPNCLTRVWQTFQMLC